MSAAEGLLKLAVHSVGQNKGVMVGRWPRMAAMLGRQAIESSMADFWQREEPTLESASHRAQFLSLPVYLGDEDLGHRVYSAWASLSRACHYHPYELPPTAPELRTWLSTANEFAAAVHQGTPANAS